MCKPPSIYTEYPYPAPSLRNRLYSDLTAKIKTKLGTFQWLDKLLSQSSAALLTQETIQLYLISMGVKSVTLLEKNGGGGQLRKRTH